MIRKPQWLQNWQAEKAALFKAEGFPTRKTEDWKYTNVSLIAQLYENKDPLTLPLSHEGRREEENNSLSPHEDFAPLNSHSPCGIGGISMLENSYSLLFENGKLNLAKSNLPRNEQVKITTWAEQFEQDPAWLREIFSKFSEAKSTPFTNLNQAKFNDGLLMHIGEGVILDKPLHFIYLNSYNGEPAEQHICNLISMGKNTSACILQESINENRQSNFSNEVHYIYLDESAQLDYIKLSPLNSQQFQICSMAFMQEKSSQVRTFHLGLGGRLVRDDLHFRLVDQHASCNIMGLYALKGDEHYDCHSRVDHAQSATSSEQIYKGIVDEKARAVFNGKVIVPQGVAKISAKQKNQNLLLTKTAEINTKPELEIYADDVSCSHGATIGDLDEKSLFYLRSRGLSESTAKEILTQAFADEILNLISEPSIAEYVWQRVQKKLRFSQGEANA